MRRALLVALALGASACEGPTDPCTAVGERAGVLVQMQFVRLSSPGVSVGFDIDDHTASAGDPLTCGHASLHDPDGNPGIDNTFGTLVPAIDAQVNGALDADVQDAINQGMLLFGIDLKHVFSIADDPCVDAEFHFLTDKPTVGSDNILDSWQTFDTNHEVPVSEVRGVIAGGSFLGGPFDLQLPVRVLDANFTLAVHKTRIKLVLADDGSFTGVIGGSIKVADILADFQDLAIGVDLKARLPGLLALIADQDYDDASGTCTEFSVAMTIAARPAFINP